jgi:hypothetical protein
MSTDNFYDDNGLEGGGSDDDDEAALVLVVSQSRFSNHFQRETVL